MKIQCILLHSITPTLCPRYTGVKPDIWLGLVSYGSEAYPMLMGKGSSTRYEENETERNLYSKKHLLFTVYSHLYSMVEYITSNVGGHWH